MKKELGLFKVISIRSVGLMMLCCVVLALFAAPAGAIVVLPPNDQGICNGALGTTTISNVAISSDVLTLTINSIAGITAGQQAALSALTTATFLNNATITVLSASSGEGGNTVTANFNHTDYASAPDTGTYAHLEYASGCGAVITVTSVDGNGAANAFSVTIPNNGGAAANGNPYDHDDDVLVGILNNSPAGSLPLTSIPLTSSDLTFGGIFGFDHDGPCSVLATDCYPNPPIEGYTSTGYEGPDNTFTNINSVSCDTPAPDGYCHTTGTVTFVNPIPTASACDQPCNSTWFALEGTPNSLALTSEMQTLNFSPANPTATATFSSGDSQHTASFTIAQVISGFSVTETANYVDTEFSSPGNATGVGIADGICEAATPILGYFMNIPQYPDNDIDCRLAAGGFVFGTVNGDQVVPHAFPYHNGQAVWYRATTDATAGDQYVGPVTDAWTWELNPSLVPGTVSPPNPEYTPGWNNENGRVYDRPGANVNSNAFVADITTFFKGCCGAGGRQPTLNDWVIAAVPNPQTGGADQEITLLPLPRPSPAPYIKGLPMPVSFVLQNITTKKFDPNALTLPNTVSISTQLVTTNGLADVPLQFPKGFPTTFQCVMLGGKCTGVYGIVLSSAPYQKNMTYNLQIGSDLFSAPVNIPFVVK